MPKLFNWSDCRRVPQNTSVRLPVPCQHLTEVSLLPTTEGGVNYLYEVSHLSLLTNSATRDLALYSLSSSVKLKDLEILSLILPPEVHRTTSAVMPSRGRAQKSLHPIALPPADLFDKGESPCCEGFTIYITKETTQTKPTKPGVRTCSRLVIVWIRVPASLHLDVQLQHEDRCLQNKGATYWLHSGGVQLSMGFYKNSA